MRRDRRDLTSRDTRRMGAANRDRMIEQRLESIRDIRHEGLEIPAEALRSVVENA